MRRRVRFVMILVVKNLLSGFGFGRSNMRRGFLGSFNKWGVVVIGSEFVLCLMINVFVL